MISGVAASRRLNEASTGRVAVTLVDRARRNGGTCPRPAGDDLARNGQSVPQRKAEARAGGSRDRRSAAIRRGSAEGRGAAPRKRGDCAEVVFDPTFRLLPVVMVRLL